MSVWLAHGDDETTALDAIHRALPEATARVAEVTVEGTRVLVIGEPAPPAERLAREGELRLAALRGRSRGGRAQGLTVKARRGGAGGHVAAEPGPAPIPRVP